MNSVGFDACWLTRPSVEVPFKAILGCGVTVKDRDKFRVKYDEVMNLCFSTRGYERKKKIYKAAYLTEQILDKSISFIRQFISELKDEISYIDIYYTYYPPSAPTQIWTCRDQYPRAFSPDQFLNLLYNPYPHYCIWKYLETHKHQHSIRIESDYFHGKLSPAWEAIKKDNLNLYHKGSECNKLISTSDLILRLICDTMHSRLTQKNIRECLEDMLDDISLYTYFMGPRSDYLSIMAFTKFIDFDARPYVKRPIYWILWKPKLSVNEEIKMFEWSDGYNEVVNSVEEMDGCMRFFDSNVISHLIDEKQDYLCIMNDDALPVCEALQSYAPDIKVLDFRSQ